MTGLEVVKVFDVSAFEMTIIVFLIVLLFYLLTKLIVDWDE